MQDDRENSDEMTTTSNNNYISDEVDVLQLCSAGNNSGDILTSYARKIPSTVPRDKRSPLALYQLFILIRINFLMSFHSSKLF